MTASASAPPGDYVFGVAATSGGLVRGTRMRLTVTNGARGFAPPVNVTRTSGFSTGSVKPDGTGVLHAVTDDDSGFVTGSEVFYRRSTDGGATFSAPVKLHATGSRAGESAFTIDPTGRIFVVWSGRVIADPTPRIYFVKSTDGGATFSAPLAVNGNTGYAVLPNVAADRNGNVVVGWYDLSGDVAGRGLVALDERGNELRDARRGLRLADRLHAARRRDRLQEQRVPRLDPADLEHVRDPARDLEGGRRVRRSRRP